MFLKIFPDGKICETSGKILLANGESEKELMKEQSFPVRKTETDVEAELLHNSACDVSENFPYGKICETSERSSYKGRKENALALGADERRGKLR